MTRLLNIIGATCAISLILFGAIFALPAIAAVYVVYRATVYLRKKPS